MESIRTRDYFAETAFLPGGWACNVLISADENGWITKVESGQTRGAATMLAGAVMPGMPNLHSHAFQRAMAGLTERATGEKDSFWTWREIMYKFLEKLTPEDQQAIATQLYVDMLKAGYTSVGEFHYLHHQTNGDPYQDRALTSRHILMAAREAGIAIAHMPVFYACSGFGGGSPLDSQKRFINNEIGILDIVSTLASAHKDDPQVTIGLAHHSLRAVAPEMLQEVTRSARSINPEIPVHIHVAEQTKEVDDCLAWSGRRPVEWLLDNAEIGAHWCLVHATHMNEAETRDLAQSGAVAGLCPTTEANLGDGLFNLPDYLREGGVFGIGSDSHISVSMTEELRLLEYGQRLLRRERAVARTQGQNSIGAALYAAALAGGAQALGRATGAIEAGKRADFIALDPENPAFAGKKKDFLFDTMIFASASSPIRDVIAGGQHVIKDFRHKNEDAIRKAYARTLEKLSG